MPNTVISAALSGLALVMLCGNAQASVLFDDGGTHIVDYNIDQEVDVVGTTTLRVQANAQVSAVDYSGELYGIRVLSSGSGPSPASIYLSDFASVYGGDSSTIGGYGIHKGYSGNLDIAGDAQVFGGYGQTGGGAAVGTFGGPTQIYGNAYLQGGGSAGVGGAGVVFGTHGDPFSISGSAIIRGGSGDGGGTGLYAGDSGHSRVVISGNAQVIGGDGITRAGGDGISRAYDGVSVTVNDNAVIRGGDSTNGNGGMGVNNTVVSGDVTMNGGTIQGGSGALSGGVAIASYVHIGDGLVTGGDGNRGGNAINVTGSWYSSDNYVRDSTVVGGNGIEQGGDGIAMALGYFYNTLSIDGSTVKGGDAYGIGGNALTLEEGAVYIFGGSFDAGSGDAEDGYLIKAGSDYSQFTEVNIFGGHFGENEHGHGFFLQADAILNLYGNLAWQDDRIFGFLRDGSAFDVLLTLGTDFTGQVNLISAVPVPPAVWLFGSGLVSLVGVAKRKRSTKVA